MDIPSCSAPDAPPPPSYNDICEFPLCAVIPATPPPSYTPATAPPAYQETQNVQGIPQYPKGSGANPYPILNVPPHTAAAFHSEHDSFQEIPLNPMRNVSNPNVDPWTGLNVLPQRPVERHTEQDNFQQIPQNPKRTTGTNPYPVHNAHAQTAMVMHSEQVMVQQTMSPVSPQVIVVQPPTLFDDIPTATVCKYCHANVITKVKYKPGFAAWSMCILLSVLGLICGFCLIPFCVRGFKDAHHSCPNCHRHLGIYIRK